MQGLPFLWAGLDCLSTCLAGWLADGESNQPASRRPLRLVAARLASEIIGDEGEAGS